jgi:predicted MPP superfamily phosphohydrolase
MPIVFLILTAIIAANLTWWRWADLRLRKVRFSRVWRTLVAIFTVGQLLYLAVLASPRLSHPVQRVVPIPFVAGTYLWSLLVLPISLLGIGISRLVTLLQRITTKTEPGRAAPFGPARPGSVAGSQPSRREILTATAVAIPPVVTAGLVLKAFPQLDRFRVRSMHLNLPGLPAKLDGIRIAHVSDLHVGRYTRPAQIPAMVEAINRLKADLVLFTGDLIDISLDDLPRGIDAMKQLDLRSGMALIEGNHDLIDNADEFDRRVLAAGLPLLIDQAMTVLVRGEPIQLLGTRWGQATGNRRHADDAAFAASIQQLKSLRDPHAFPILLAHHPHTFDPAAAAGFPLTLSGHTHGGQLMLTPEVGCGPLFYRYWSGVYQTGSAQLVVNNGVGNWFPLRVNAPAEIIELILHPV